MRYHILLVNVFLGLLFLGACSDPVGYVRDKYAAEAGLSQALSELSAPAEFEIVATVRIQGERFQPSGRACFLSRGYAVLGSTLPKGEALDTYYLQVQDLDWRAEERPSASSRLLHRGNNELMEIHTREPGVDIEGVLRPLTRTPKTACLLNNPADVWMMRQPFRFEGNRCQIS